MKMKLFILLITISITLAAVINQSDDNDAVLKFKNVESVVSEDAVLPGIIDEKRVKRDFWDGIPLFSQFKSAIQAIQGDLEGAKQTQENFSKQALGVSQIRSAVEAGLGDEEAAKQTQLQFVDQTLKGYEQLARKATENAVVAKG